MSVQRIRRMGFGGLIALFVLWAFAFIFKTSFIAIDGHRYFALVDDAMISMRYAWNLSHGNGLVWNSGVHIEGFTNLLQTLYMSLCTLVFSKSSAVLAVQVTGIPIVLLVAVVTMRISTVIAKDAATPHLALVKILTFIATLAYFPLAYWSLLGMETGLLSLLLLSAVFLAIRANNRQGDTYVLSVLLGLAFMTRPDALVQAVPIGAFYIVAARGERRRRLVIVSSIVTLFIVSVSLWRLAYYGSVVPNTFVLKMTGMALGDRLTNGLGFIRLFVWQSWPVLLIAVVGCLFLRTKRSLLLLILVLSSIAYQIWIGGDPWIYWRLMAPFMPLAFILCIVGLARLVPAALPHKSMYYVLLTGCTAFLMACVDAPFSAEQLLRHAAYEASSAQQSVNTAVALNAVTTAGASEAVIGAGTLPYYTEKQAIDLLGKSDAFISHRPPDLSGDVSWYGMFSVPGHNKYDLNYSILVLKPTFTQRLTWGHDDVTRRAPQYKTFYYKTIPLLLDTGSHDVYWERLNGASHR